MPAATLHLQYYRSAIGRSWRQKEIIRGLGFTKLQQVVLRPDTPSFRGMVAKVPHLVRIVDGETRAPKHTPGTAKSGAAAVPAPAKKAKTKQARS